MPPTKTALSVQLGIHGKKTEPLDLKKSVLTYIRSTYSDREADESADDCEMVNALRAEIAGLSTAGNASAREALIKYFCCLTSIETRFPISKEKGHIQLTFTWFDAFDKKKKSQINIHFEKAAVLFNLACVISQMAIACDRTTGDGLKQACHLYQEAAGVFAFLRERESNKVDSPPPTDLSNDCVALLEKLMLTQAQECVFNKAVIEGKSASLLARLAKQQTIMYSEVERAFASGSLASYFDKSWLAHTQMKASVYDVETLVRQASSYVSDDPSAEVHNNWAIAALTEAFKRVQSTKNLAKAVSNEMKDSVNAMQDAIQARLSKCERDNHSVYLEKVPAFSELPPIQGALLSKPIPIAALEFGQEGLFSGLVPDSSAKAISRYQELVDTAVRKIRDSLAAATDEARLKLRVLNLPDILEALDARTTASLSEGLKRDLEDIQSVGGYQHLKDILAEVGQIRASTDKDLFQIQAELDNDATADAEARNQYGEQYRVAPASTVAKPYWDKVAVYRESLKKAGESDASVMKRLQDHEAAFADLTVDAAITKMPRLQAPMVSVGPEDPAVVVATLRRNLDLLQTLASERAAMEETVRDIKMKDNVLPKLLATPPQGHEALFAAEMKKYDGIQEDMQRNLEQQNKTLIDVEMGHKSFMLVFDVAGWRASCEAASNTIRENIKTFRELLNHLSEGLRFYIGTAEVITRTLQESQDFVYTRGVQREELKQDIERRKQQGEADKLSRQMQQASLHAPAVPTNYPAPPGGEPG